MYPASPSKPLLPKRKYLTKKRRLTHLTGYSVRCPVCETEYAIKAEEMATGDYPLCPVCDGGLPRPVTNEEKEARMMLHSTYHCMVRLNRPSLMPRGDIRPSVKRDLERVHRLQALIIKVTARYENERYISNPYTREITEKQAP